MFALLTKRTTTLVSSIIACHLPDAAEFAFTHLWLVRTRIPVVILMFATLTMEHVMLLTIAEKINVLYLIVILL
jgi:hypothetical protein